MTDAMVAFERSRQELDRFHQQILMGTAIHLPTYHRTVKAIAASVAAISSERQQGHIPKPSSFARGCLGKFPYGSEQSAAAAPVRLRETLEPYRCRFCGKWHLGHPRSAVRASEVLA